MKKLIACLVVTFLFFAVPIDAKNKEKQGREEGGGSATKSIIIDSGVPPTSSDLPQGLSDSLSIESQSCTYWHYWGHHSWSWYGIPLIYISWNNYGKTWAEYGTSTGSCGIPLIADRLYVKVQLYYRNLWENFNRAFGAPLENTAYNTNFVDKSANGWCVGPACPTPCGAIAYHEFSKNGVTWNFSGGSGCA